MFNAEKLYADRIGGEKFGKDTTVYKFAKIKSAKQAFKKAHPDISVIDLGVGEHDGIAPMPVRSTLKKEIDNPSNRGYADNGILEFQQAAAKYLNRMLGIDLPTDEEAAKYVMHGIGSKGILSLLPLTVINPGDVTIMTVPGYPVLGTHTGYLGGHVVKVPLSEENGFLPDLETLTGHNPEEIDSIIPVIEEMKGKVKLVCVNYPNNPTGADATPEFWEKLVEIAHKYNFIIVHDAAYSSLTYKGEPNSPLQVDGGLDVSLGVYSLSKAFNMIGYRIAFVAGNPKLIAAYANVKDNSDSGQAKMMQRAGITALEHSEDSELIRIKYQRRLSRLVEVLNSHGFKAEMPAGTFFLYTRAPTGTKDGKRFETAEDASQYMLLEQGISVVPWDDVGHYIRFSATFESGNPSTLTGEQHQEEKILGELDKRLGKLKLKFD
jgi:LL-diaminopimelate aminotransferase